MSRLSLDRAIAGAWRERALPLDAISAANASGEEHGRDADGACQRSAAILSELIGGTAHGSVDLGAFLDRCATLVQLSSLRVGTLMTSLPSCEVDRGVACGIAVVMADLVLACEAGTPVGERARVYVAADRNAAELTLAVACPEAANAVPSAVAASAYRRATRLATVLGGSTVRGVRDGLMLYGACLTLMASARRSEL